MAQVDPPKEIGTFERINGRPPLLSLNKMTHYFIEWTTLSGLLKKLYYPYHDAQIDPLNKSCSEKL